MSNLIRKSALSLLMVVTASAQTVFIPGGTGGIGSSSTSNVGVGTAAATEKLEVSGGNILVSGVVNPFLMLKSSATGTPYGFLQYDQSEGNFMRLYDGSQYSMVWRAGNVGIGTATPAFPLNIAGHDSSVQLRLERTNTSQGIFDIGADNSGLTFYPGGYPSSGSSKFFIGNSGNVGIGTTNTGELLTVGDSSASPNIRLSRWAFLGQESSHLTTVIGGNIKALGNSSVVAETTGDGYRAIRMKYDEGITFHAYQGYVSAGNTVGNERMRITPGGNVGIGTTNPSHKLAVNGTIRTKEVIVDTGWADYVFDEGYRLAPLAEVEAHILEKKRLPGIPSADEVEKEGVSVGDMQARLLAKIEELTLHLITQEKLLTAHAGELRILRQENTEMRSQLSKATAQP